jgi:hypothetical protein
LVVLKAALLATMLGAGLLAMRDAGGGLLAAALVSVVITAGGLASFVTLRPQMFSFPLFAIFLLAMTRADAGRPRLLGLTPALTLVWSNLHGGVAAGIAVLAYWGALRLAQAGAVRTGWRLPRLLQAGAPGSKVAATIIIVLLLHPLAALATPYGLDLWRYLGETVGSPISDVTEWRAPSLAVLEDALGMGAVVLLAAALLVRARGRDPVHLLIIGALVIAGLSVRRHLTLAVIGTAMLAAPHVAHALRGLDERRRASRPLSLVMPLFACGILAVGVARARCVQILPGTIPRSTVAYLKAAQVAGNLVVFYDWGAYAIWHLGPRLRVSIDGRRETLYSPDLLRANLEFLDALPGWRRMLDEHGADVALLSPRFQVYERLGAEPECRLAFTDDVSGLFVRRGTAADRALAGTPLPLDAGAGECLGRSG